MLPEYIALAAETIAVATSAPVAMLHVLYVGVIRDLVSKVSEELFEGWTRVILNLRYARTDKLLLRILYQLTGLVASMGLCQINRCAISAYKQTLMQFRAYHKHSIPY
jgi:hypothetical protein